MDFNNKVYCHWDFVRFFPEKEIIENDSIISVTENDKFELMIFLGKSDNSEYLYEVRIYKVKPEDSYVKNELDYENLYYEENDEYISLYFDSYDRAKEFIVFSLYLHKELLVRPLVLIGD